MARVVKFAMRIVSAITRNQIDPAQERCANRRRLALIIGIGLTQAPVSIFPITPNDAGKINAR
jgi:hypothetical protein